MQVSKIICRMCRMSCGLNFHLDNGSIVDLTGMQEHFRNTLCVKPFAIPELIHASSRLKSPMIKKNGVQQKSTWDEAFDIAVNKLRDIKNEYGAQAVVTHSGQSYVGTVAHKMPKRFCDLFGTPNFTTGGSLCFLSEIVAFRSTGLPLACPSYSPSTKLMIYWGLNPSESAPIDRDKALSLKARGAKLIIIDPKRTDLAKIADMHIQHRPGTDCALALGLLNVIIEEELYDKDFTENWTYGFDKLIDHVKKYSPEVVEKITWVPAEKIVDLARIYSENKPGIISIGISLEDSSNGVQAMRALITLMSIVGNLDVPGGNIVPSPPFKVTDLSIPDKAPKIQGIGADYPLFTEFTGEQQMSRLLDQIINDDPYPIRALLVGGSDIFLSWPNTNKLKKAIEKLEFLLVIDCFMNETVQAC